MGIIKCDAGHYYDPERYEKCPYCKKEKKGVLHARRDPKFEDGLTVAKEKKREKPSFFSKSSAHREGKFDEEKTVGIRDAQSGKKRVAGWIVCYQGEDAGRDYRLYHGFNYIGRNFSMDVCLNHNSGIAEEKHGAIVYDGRQNQFFVVAVNGSILLNERPIVEMEELQDGDRLQFGNEIYIFIPFCKGERTWGKN